MFKTKYLLFLTLFFSYIAQADVSTELKVVGQGEVHYMGVIKVYDAKLSVSNNATAANILAANVSRCLQLDYAVDLTADKFVLAANTILERQHDTAPLQRLKPQIDQLHNSYQPVKKGEQYQMCYDARTQTTSLQLNGQSLVSIKSPEFAELYFGIWLGETKPVSSTLRNNLLQNL